MDAGSQCNIKSNDTSLQKEVELEEDLRLAKEQIFSMEAEKQQLKAHNKRRFNGYETEYKELLSEKTNILEELTKIQFQRDLAFAKIEALEEKAVTSEVDECIANQACEGNCEHVGFKVQQAKNLNVMKNQGGRRSSPVEQVAKAPCIYCTQCNFTARNKSTENS